MGEYTRSLKFVVNFNIEHPTFVESQLVVFAVPYTSNRSKILIRISSLDEKPACALERNSKN